MTRPTVARIDSLLGREARAAGSMAKAMTPEPIGKPGGPGLFHVKGLQLPPYIQHVRNELMKQGHSESAATERAIGIIEDWKNGHMPGSSKPVHADTQAAAALAWTEWLAARAKAHATPNKRDENGDSTEHRFNPSQPRAPAGAAGGGEWAAQGGTAPSDSSTPQGRAWAKNQIGNYPPNMVKASEKKKWDNWFRFFAMTPEQQKAFLDAAKHKKPPKPRGAPHGPPKRTKKRSDAEAILERRVSA